LPYAADLLDTMVPQVIDFVVVPYRIRTGVAAVAGRLDLDDTRAKVVENRRPERAGEHVGQVDDE
jgi:hypothetical protein